MNNKIILNEIMSKSNQNLDDSQYEEVTKNLQIMTNIFNRLIEYDLNGTIISGKPFLKKICNEINSSFGTNLSKNEIFKLLEMIAKTKKTKKNKDSVNKLNEMTGGFEITERMQFWIGVLGLIPAFGTVPDAVNIIIYLSKGMYIEALWSLLAFLPVIGFPIGIYNLFFRSKNNEVDYEDEYEDEYDDENYTE